MPVAKSPYRLAPSEMQELSEQLQEELNKLTVKNRYPLPRIDDLFDQLRGACPFLKVDFQSGYHQLRVHEDAIQRPSKEEHEVHLKLVLESLRKEKLYAKFSKCEFGRKKCIFLVTWRRIPQGRRRREFVLYGSNLSSIGRKICLRGEGCNVKDFWLAVNSLRYLSENEIESPWILLLNFQGQSSEYDVKDAWTIRDYCNLLEDKEVRRSGY
ncbi:hypothetical protein Tco_0134624 [Tanacetum coccineum]